MSKENTSERLRRELADAEDEIGGLREAIAEARDILNDALPEDEDPFDVNAEVAKRLPGPLEEFIGVTELITGMVRELAARLQAERPPQWPAAPTGKPIPAWMHYQISTVVFEGVTKPLLVVLKDEGEDAANQVRESATALTDAICQALEISAEDYGD